MREYFVANAGYWIDEFHLDGLRLDATQSIHDQSAEHIVAAIARGARAGGGRRARSSSSPRTSRRTSRMVRPLERGRLRPRRALERRLPPQRRRRADRAPRGVLLRPSRHAAGVHLGREVRLPVPGPALRAGRSSRAARRADGLPPARVRQLHREPRPGRELRRRLAPAPARRRRAATAR